MKDDDQSRPEAGTILGPDNQQDLQVFPMQALTQIPVLHAAIEYSLLYMLFGGGIFGAAVIYFIARAMGK
jgi:hypothetical protein